MYAKAAERGEVVRVLAALERLNERGELDDCHLEAHRLAHAAFRVVGDVERTFLLGGPQCRLGYLHGAVEASSAVPRCRRFTIGAQRGACSHGYGHALMLRTGHDLERSIGGCSTTRGIDREPCELGVMMQNSLRFAGRRDYALASARACAAVRGRLARLCFDNIGVVAALSSGHDPTRAAAACEPLATVARANCVRGAHAEIAEEARAD